MDYCLWSFLDRGYDCDIEILSLKSIMQILIIQITCNLNAIRVTRIPRN